MEQLFKHKFGAEVTFTKPLNFCNYIYNVRLIY